MEDALYDIESIRRFAGFTSVTAALPDETTIFKIRHWLEEKMLMEPLLVAINGHLKAQGMLISKGAMVDRDDPSFTKSVAGELDPDMHWTKNLA